MQNVLDLNEYGVAQMQNAEMVQTDGGTPIHAALLIGIGLVVGVSAINGLYNGMIDSYNENHKAFRGAGASGSW
jgi:hypothetical protein